MSAVQMNQKKYKILLIEPPFYRLFKNTYSLTRYPLSLGYLAGAVKKETAWDVLVYNADFNSVGESIKLSHLTGPGFDAYLDNLKNRSGPVWREIESTIRGYQPDVVGISVKSQNFASGCIIAGLVKEINAKSIVIVGGPHPCMAGIGVFGCSDIDIAVMGEGEKTIVELLKAVEDREGFENIKGIAFRKEGKIVENSRRENIENLDSLCFPYARAKEVLKDYNKYPLAAFGNIFAIMGCPFSCLFCGSNKIWGRQPRFRSVNNIIEEIKSLQRAGLKTIHFDDDTFGINKKFISDLCNAIIKYCPGLNWNCEMHVNLIDDSTISLMKKAGCTLIQVGIESGNNAILKDMRKSITIEDALAACKIIKKYGITLSTFFIVGFPQETEETLNETIKAMERSESDNICYSIFTPYPGTELFELCKKKGLIGQNYDIALYNHNSPANCFCANLPRDKFRERVSQIEKMVDRKNRHHKLKQIFSTGIINKIKEIGLKGSIKKGINLLINK